MYNLLVVEDEKYTRNFIGEYLRKKFGDHFVVYTAENAVDAIEILNNNSINLVFTDIMMSGMSGIELAEYIYNNFNDIIVIIISGHSEFEYARKAIKYNVREYLLKPLELSELRAQVEKVKKELDSREKNTFIKKDEVLEEQERFFVDVVYGGIDTFENISEKASKLSFSFQIETTPCDVLAVTIEGYETFLEEKWIYGKDSLKSSVSNLLSGFMGTENIFCIKSDEGDFEYIVYHNGVELNYNDISNKIYALLKLPIKISKKSGTFENINDLIKYFKENESIKEKTVLFMTYVKENNAKEAKRILKSIHEGNNLKFMLFELGLAGHMKYEGIDNIDDLYNDICSCSKQQENNISESIERAKKYIQDNFYKNISREDVANIVYLSPTYFTINFKHYTGESFSDYLFKVRMENAIKYMKENKYKVYEIAPKVGYNNIKYFYRVFKIYTGYTPKEYTIRVLGQTQNNS